MPNNGQWIVAQIMRIRAMEKEIKGLLANAEAPSPSLRHRIAELNSQVAMLELALN